MGPSGNVDPIVPFKTKTYRDGGEAAEGGGIPMCTLRNFPHLPDHCIESATTRAPFSGTDAPCKSCRCRTNDSLLMSIFMFQDVVLATFQEKNLSLVLMIPSRKTFCRIIMI